MRGVRGGRGSPDPSQGRVPPAAYRGALPQGTGVLSQALAAGPQAPAVLGGAGCRGTGGRPRGAAQPGGICISFACSTPSPHAVDLSTLIHTSHPAAAPTPQHPVHPPYPLPPHSWLPQTHPALALQTPLPPVPHSRPPPKTPTHRSAASADRQLPWHQEQAAPERLQASGPGRDRQGSAGSRRADSRPRATPLKPPET